AQREHAVLALDLDLVLLEARQLGRDQDAVLLLGDVHRGRPGGQIHLVVPLGPAEGRAEGPVEPVLQGRELTIGFPTRQIHEVLLEKNGVHTFTVTGFLTSVSVSPSVETSSSAMSPSRISPASNFAASASETFFWMSRFSGRAPKVGS